MKNPLPKIALVFLLLLPLLGRAQEIRISGRVVDAVTKKPVPFASLCLRNSGASTLTNENGDFQLVGLKPNEQDSIIVMTIGYERYATIITSNSLQNLTVELIRRYFKKVEEYTSNCGPSTIPKPNLITGVLGTQYAFFIVNEKHQKLGKLQTVSFYLGENGLPTKPFRIRIYKDDGPDHAPGTDLLIEQVFFTATESGRWYTCDLRRYNISVPQEGYFVALELGKPSDTLTQPSIENYVPLGHIMRPPYFIRPVFKSEKSTTWKYSPNNNGWKLLKQIERLRIYNAMIKAEAEAVN